MRHLNKDSLSNGMLCARLLLFWSTNLQLPELSLMAAVSEEMANSEKESDISVETLPEGRPIRRNIYGSVISSFFFGV